MTALLAMRELRSPEIARFLHDEEPLLVREAASAIHEENIAGAWPQLAALIEHPTGDEALMDRALNSNFRIGQAANARALASFAGCQEAGDALRIDALKLLGSWGAPPPFNYISGAAQSTDPRDTAPARDALAAMMPQLLAVKSPEVIAAAQAARRALAANAR